MRIIGRFRLFLRTMVNLHFEVLPDSIDGVLRWALELKMRPLISRSASKMIISDLRIEKLGVLALFVDPNMRRETVPCHFDFFKLVIINFLKTIRFRANHRKTS